MTDTTSMSARDSIAGSASLFAELLDGRQEEAVPPPSDTIDNLAVVWESGDWNISDLGTKPTDTPTNQRLVPIICGQAELPIPAGQKILFGPVDKPVRRESTNLAVALKSMTNTEA